MRAAPILRRPGASETAILGGMLGVIIVILASLTGGKLLTPSSLAAMAFQVPLLALLTLAQLPPMITSGIDLSIVSVANLSGIVAALLLVRWHTPQAVWVAVPAALATAATAGAVNGVLVAGLDISPIIATLATMILFQGVSFVLTKGTVLSGFPPQFLALSTGSVAGVPFPFLIFASCLLGVAVLLRRTPFGVTLYMLGSNPLATLFSGIDTRWALFRTYLLSGVLAGVAAVVMISRFNAAQADYGSSYLLLTVLTCVLGGVDPSGGSGSVLGVLAAIALLQIVATGFNFLGLSAYLANALWGILLVLVIVLRRTQRS